MGFTGYLLGFTEFEWILPSLITFFWFLPSFTGFCLGFYGLSLGFIEFYWVLPSFTWFQASVTMLNWDSLGFTRF